MPRLAATSIAVFMRVFDALWVGRRRTQAASSAAGQGTLEARMYSSSVAALSS
jgi:hypothetical protein